MSLRHVCGRAKSSRFAAVCTEQPRLRAVALTDLEALQAFGLLLGDRHRLDLSAARAFAAERDQSFDGVLFAFEHRLDRAVPPVGHPPRDAVLLCEPARRVTEEDA